MLRLVLSIAIVLIVNSNKILNLLGKGYVDGQIIFCLIMFSQFMNSFTGPNGTILVMTKYTNFEIFNGILKLITSVIVILLYGAKFIWAVALSIALSELSSCFVIFIDGITYQVCESQQTMFFNWFICGVLVLSVSKIE